jgi:hypothetical protein
MLQGCTGAWPLDLDLWPSAAGDRPQRVELAAKITDGRCGAGAVEFSAMNVDDERHAFAGGDGEDGGESHCWIVDRWLSRFVWSGTPK